MAFQGDKKERRQIKQINGEPTIPVSSDHRNGDWIATDLYKGELAQDTNSGLVYTRIGNEILGVSVNVITRDYADVLALANASELEKGGVYYLADKDITLTAITSMTFCLEGCRTMRIVKNDFYQLGTFSGVNKLGVWNTSLTPIANDIAVWGGKCWFNNSGNVGSAVDDTALDSEWTITPTDNNNYYEDKSFFILYDFFNDWVNKQFDDRGNVLGIKYDASLTYNPVEISDWGNINIYRNICVGVYNNSNNAEIYDNRILGAIYSNSNSGNIAFNNNEGGIFDNTNTDAIVRNSNKGVISGNSNQGAIVVNTNHAGISIILTLEI